MYCIHAIAYSFCARNAGDREGERVTEKWERERISIANRFIHTQRHTIPKLTQFTMNVEKRMENNVDDVDNAYICTRRAPPPPKPLVYIHRIHIPFHFHT